MATYHLFSGGLWGLGGDRRPLRRLGMLMLVLALLPALAACGTPMRFPVTASGQASLQEQNINVIRMTPENIGFYSRASETRRAIQAPNPPADPVPYAYLVGAGDELRIQVWSDPERTQIQDSMSAERGLVVSESGSLFYPFVGAIRAEGRTVGQIRSTLTEQLRAYITDPQVEVSVLTFNAHRATITGAVSNPGPTTLTNVPLRLLDIVNAAGVGDESDLTRVALRRRGGTHIVNLQAFLKSGDARQNPILLPGDLVNVPPMEDNKVFTFGEISTREIPLGTTRKTLTEVLASSGGIDRIRADARGVFVFRRTPRTPDGFDVYQFDLSSAAALVLATNFEMAPLDIVFVTNDPVTRWNDTVGKMVSPFHGLLAVQRIAEAVE